MASITIELDDRVQTNTCTQCGFGYPRVRGFLYRDGDAWAAYWAELYKDHPDHPDARAVLTIALGDDWAEDSGAVGHAWVQIDTWPADNEVRMSFIDPEGELTAAIFGLPLSRDAALSDSRKSDFLLAADEIVNQDPRVADLMSGSD